MTLTLQRPVKRPVQTRQIPAPVRRPILTRDVLDKVYLQQNDGKRLELSGIVDQVEFFKDGEIRVCLRDVRSLATGKIVAQHVNLMHMRGIGGFDYISDRADAESALNVCFEFTGESYSYRQWSDKAQAKIVKWSIKNVSDRVVTAKDQTHRPQYNSEPIRWHQR